MQLYTHRYVYTALAQFLPNTAEYGISQNDNKPEYRTENIDISGNIHSEQDLNALCILRNLHK